MARALVNLTDRLGVGARYEAVVLETFLRDVPSQVRIDAAVRGRLEALGRPAPEQRADTLVGVLFEADFESFTAKLRAPDGRVVTVGFAEEQAEDIKRTLRERAQLVGEVTYDPHTSQAVSVAVRTITRAGELELQFATEDFWTDRTIEELRVARGIKPVEDPAVLRAEDLSDEEAEELLAALDS